MREASSGGILLGPGGPARAAAIVAGRLSSTFSQACTSVGGRMREAVGGLAGSGGAVPRLRGADHGIARVLRAPIDDVGPDKDMKKDIGGVIGGVGVTAMIAGVALSGRSDDEPGGGGGQSGDDVSGDARDDSADAETSKREEPLRTGLPAYYERLLNRVEGYPSTKERIREFCSNGWRIRFTEPDTLPKAGNTGDHRKTYLDWDHVDDRGRHTMWLSTELMNQKPEDLLQTIAEAIP
ncbi:hypothetical protein [Nocardia sp. CC227C]|uniref:hypothetical protein n=1 Tax=Nocardia sp. CC227C TaxID=3044562 RepID=UPI00278BBF1B|nr:hypothetical protein [Nocardia sp. CC227C]